MRIDILTIFPEIFQGAFEHGIIRRARQQSLTEITIHNLRDFTYDRHQVTDDRPFGGGEGMALKPEPIFRAIEYLTHTPTSSRAICLLSPQGKTFTQTTAIRLSKLSQLLLICGRYEGVDERVNEQLVTEEISIGDYVLSGGEFAALVVVDAIVRLIPNAVGCANSTENESFSSGLLDCPVYTRPAIYRGLSVPQVLLNGNHAEIARWRRYQALKKTYHHRPDLLMQIQLSPEDEDMLEHIRTEADKAGSATKIG
ncbi:MAG: tRNA (guanosine(37)-N1)-methyltransferase TrmD [Acidobacteriota bacterium]